MKTLTDIKSYILAHHGTHHNIKVAKNVFELLAYIDQHLDSIAKLAGKKKLFRHPVNHMAVHLHGTKEEVKQQLSGVITQVKQCFSEFFSVKNPETKSHLINGFLSNIDDSDVGCMEVRLKKAFSFYGLYQSRGEILELHDLMREFLGEGNIVADEGMVAGLLNFFSDSVAQKMPVSHDNCIQILTWDLIKNYLKETLVIDNIDALWARYYQNNFVSSGAVIVPVSHWCHYNFSNESSAIQCLNYIKSIIGHEELPGFNKAEVRYNDGNQVYTFRLTQQQRDRFKALVNHSLVSLEDDNPEFNELLYPSLPFNVDVDIGKEGDKVKVIFKDQNIAKIVLARLKATIYQYIQKTPIASTEGYYFILPEALLETYRTALRAQAEANLPNSDFFIKSIRSDKHSYIRKFIKYIFLPNTSYPLRIGDKERYTVTGEGIFARSEEWASEKTPFKKPQYEKAQKTGYSNFQSTSMGTPDFFPKVFGFDKNRPLVGAIFSGKDNVLPSDRLFIYDGGTVNRCYDFHSLEQAQKYYDNKVNKVLFSAEKLENFKLAIKRNKFRHNEALVRIKGTADEGLRVFIGTDNLESRLIAQEYARLINKHLHQNNLCAPDYKVSITYYTPDDEDLHFKAYTPEEQLLDYLHARLMLKDKKNYQEQIRQKKFGCLFALNEKEILRCFFKKKNNILIDLIQAGHTHVFLSLLDRVDTQNSSSDQIESLLAIKDSDGDTALMWTAFNGYSQYLELMLKKLNAQQIKALLTIQNNNGDTALMLAVRNGHNECLELMLEKLDAQQIEALLAIQNNYGGTALMWTARNGHSECLELMLEKLDAQQIEALLAIQNNNGDTALMLAIRNGHNECLELMLEKLDAQQIKALLAIKDSDGDTALMLAVRNGHSECLKVVLEKLDAQQIEALLAIQNNNGDTALMLAVRNGHSEYLKVMLEKLNAQQIKALLAIQNDDGDTALTLAVEEDRSEYLKVMLEKLNAQQIEALLAIKDSDGDTALTLAAKRGYSQYIKVMLKKLDAQQIEALLAIKDRYGNTALMLAIRNGHNECLELMLEKLDVQQIEALLAIKDRYGNTALMWTARNGYSDGHSECLELMLEKLDVQQIEALLAIKDRYGNTALIWAVRYSYSQCLKVMLEKLDAQQIETLLAIQNNNGDTALMWTARNTARNGYNKCLELMLEKLDVQQIEALLAIQNNNGDTALTWAVNYSYSQCLKIMLKKLGVIAVAELSLSLTEPCKKQMVDIIISRHASLINEFNLYLRLHDQIEKISAETQSKLAIKKREILEKVKQGIQKDSQYTLSQDDINILNTFRRSFGIFNPKKTTSLTIVEALRETNLLTFEEAQQSKMQGSYSKS